MARRGRKRRNNENDGFFLIDTSKQTPCVREVTPPPKQPPPNYTFFDFKQGDSLETALTKNPLIRGLLGHFPMAAHKPKTPVSKSANDFGPRLANHADFTFAIKKKLEKAVKEKGSVNFVSAREMAAEEPELVPFERTVKKTTRRTKRVKK